MAMTQILSKQQRQSKTPLQTFANVMDLGTSLGSLVSKVGTEEENPLIKWAKARTKK